MTISLVPDDLADSLWRHEEEYDAFDFTGDGVLDDEPETRDDCGPPR